MSYDLKCLSLIIGIQSQSSKYPCTYCKSSYDSKNGIWGKSLGDRTFCDIDKLSSLWIKETNGIKEKSKKYYNCVKAPMIIGNKVIDKCPPAPLHVCKTGPFNHMIKNLAKLCPKVVLEFVSEINVSSEKYHGGDYEGNEVEKCFRNLDLLENNLMKTIKIM